MLSTWKLSYLHILDIKKLYDHTANGSKTARNENIYKFWAGYEMKGGVKGLENVVTLLLNCGNTKLRLLAFKWFPLHWRKIIEWYKSHTFSLHFSLPSFLLALIIPKASQEQEYPRSWDFKHQKIPALWTPCLLLFSNAMTYIELSQAREEWRTRRGLVGGSVFSEVPLMRRRDWQGLSLWSLRRVTPLSSYFGFCSHKSHLRGHQLAASQPRRPCGSSLKSWFWLYKLSDEIRMENGFRLRHELWSHVASSLMGLQHENTHDFISDNNGAGVRDRITQERNVALTVQVIDSRAEADERLASAVIKCDISDGDGHPKVTWLPAAHITLVRNQEISHLKNPHASSVPPFCSLILVWMSWQRFRLLFRFFQLYKSYVTGASKSLKTPVRLHRHDCFLSI